jgi:multiple sugar transport system ATP-binding protein
MGRAIVRNPKVFLMDEPLSNLDAKLRVQMRAEIAALHNRLGVTIIYVTHDQTEAMTLGTRIVVLKDGVIMQVDSPQKLYNEPNNLFVAGFIGSPQMNFVDAKVEVAGSKATLVFGDFKVELPAE